MLRAILKYLKKKLFHLLTSANADVAFYTEAYITSNKEWIMKRPIVFALNLVKINFNCLILHRNYSFKELLPGRKCLARIHRRPKVYLFAVELMKYPYIITDVFGSLFEMTVDFDTIYRKIEDTYHLPGFADLRKKKANNSKTISSIYEELSQELSATISKDIEISLLKEHLILNPYLKKALDIAIYNKTAVIGILDSSYSKEDLEDLFSDYSIKLTDLYVTSERKQPLHRIRNEFIQQHRLDHDKTEEKFLVLSANYHKAFQRSGKYPFAQKYYRSSKEIMKSIPFPALTTEFREVYQTVTGIELFGGLYNHKNLYELTYLYLAPVVYAFLTEVNQRAVSTNARVLALCDPECIYVSLYKKYFGELNTCIWSGFAGVMPATRGDWDYIIEDSPLIKSYPADRIAYALGFSFPNQLLKGCKDDFIDAALKQSRIQKKEAILGYLKHYLPPKERLLVVDPMPGISSLQHFHQFAQEMKPQEEFDTLSINQYLNRQSGELRILHRVLQMDTPYLMGIYSNTVNENRSTGIPQEEFSFLQPPFIEELKKKIIHQALIDFCNSFHAYQSKSNSLRLYPSDMNALLDHSREGLLLLEEELGGYFE